MNDDSMDAQIRRRAGHADPRELAAAAIAAAERAGDARELRARLCEQAGLPPSMGARLRGEDAGTLKDDAESLAAELRELSPEPTISPIWGPTDG